MKKLALTFVFFALAVTVNAQVGIGTPTPADAAILDIDSNNKGVLIPRVVLTGATDTTTIDGTQINSLLVYNTVTAGADPNVVTEGFYYWLTDRWERIVNEAHLNSVLEEINQSFEDIHDLINYIAPDNPNAPVDGAGDPLYTHHTVVWDTTGDGSFHYVIYDGTNYVTSPIDFGALETDTSIVPANTGTEGAGDLQIIYNYLKEAHLKDDTGDTPPDTINITDGVLQSIEHNESIQNAIIELIQGGGTVYYGTADGTFTENVLYYIDENDAPIRIDTAVVVQGTTNTVDNVAQINQIKTNLGDAYGTATAAFTGDTWIDGKAVYKGTYAATVTGGTANLEAPISLTGFTGINVISIRLIDGATNQIINTATTNVSVTGNALNFQIGTGDMYNVLDSVNKAVNVIVEFAAVAQP